MARREQPARERDDGRVPRAAPPRRDRRAARELTTAPLRLDATEALFARAKRVVPGGIPGHQNPALLVPGAYPYFFARGRGAHVWDVDGNRYVDLLCSYGPIVLGHAHAKVDEAARRQAALGDCFDGPAPVFVELAERLVDLTPWAAWATFAKNGSDVCAWATMIARAATGRRKVLVARGAYHGTYPWCTPVATGTTPEDRAHVVPFAWNDLAGVDAVLDAHAGDVAAIMVTPFRHDAYHDQEMAAPGFLAGLRARCGRLGAVLILDDVRAGFRLHVGGSGEHVGVQPDLTCYSKALANGYALSALVGRDALRDAVTRTFVTGTYWPGAVAMAAALACLDELAGTDAIPRMAALGERLRRGMEAQAAAHRLAVRYTGPPAIPFMTFVADEGAFRRSRTFAAACIQRGVYLHPHHNWFLSAAHTEEDVDAVLDATEEAFREVAR